MSIAKIHFLKGSYDAALIEYERCLAIYEKISGKDFINCYFPLDGMSNVYEKQGNKEKAIDCTERSFEIKLKIWGGANEETQTTKSRLDALRVSF